MNSTPDAAAPFLSIVVLGYRGFAATTGQALRTLLAQPLPKQTEMILVDNGSDDGSAQECERVVAKHPFIRYLPLSPNVGYGGGMNAGTALARGAWLLLVSADTLFPPSALPSLVATLRVVAPTVGIVGAVTNSAGTGQYLALPGLTIDEVMQVGQQAMQSPCGVLSPGYRTDFFAVAVRKSAWDMLKGLDRVYGPGYYEDFDFSLRVRAAGFEQVIAEDVFIAHVGSATFSSDKPYQRELIRRNRKIFLSRHPKAEMSHRREGNAEALRCVLAAAKQRGWTDALRARAAWRLATLLGEEPRSPFKRWRWRWRTRDIRGALAAAGIEPRIPSPSA